MRRLLTTLLLSVVPLAASAASIFDNWINDDRLPGGNLVQGLGDDIANGNYFSGNGFSFVSEGDAGVAIKAHYWDGAPVTLWVEEKTGSATTATKLFSTDDWNSALSLTTPNQIIYDIDITKISKSLGFAAGTEFSFFLTVGGNTFAANAVVFDDYPKGFPGQKGTIIGFDISGKGTYDDFVIMVGNSTISAVPEPETYAMLLAGLGIIGAVARRKTLS